MYVSLSEKFHEQVRRRATKKYHDESTSPQKIEPGVDPYGKISDIV